MIRLDNKLRLMKKAAQNPVIYVKIMQTFINRVFDSYNSRTQNDWNQNTTPDMKNLREKQAGSLSGGKYWRKFYCPDIDAFASSMDTEEKMLDYVKAKWNPFLSIVRSIGKESIFMNMSVSHGSFNNITPQYMINVITHIDPTVGFNPAEMDDDMLAITYASPSDKYSIYIMPSKDDTDSTAYIFIAKGNKERFIRGINVDDDIDDIIDGLNKAQDILLAELNKDDPDNSKKFSRDIKKDILKNNLQCTDSDLSAIKDWEYEQPQPQAPKATSAEFRIEVLQSNRRLLDPLIIALSKEKVKFRTITCPAVVARILGKFKRLYKVAVMYKLAATANELLEAWQKASLAKDSVITKTYMSSSACAGIIVEYRHRYYALPSSAYLTLRNIIYEDEAEKHKSKDTSLLSRIPDLGVVDKIKNLGIFDSIRSSVSTKLEEIQNSVGETVDRWSNNAVNALGSANRRIQNRILPRSNVIKIFNNLNDAEKYMEEFCRPQSTVDSSGQVTRSDTAIALICTVTKSSKAFQLIDAFVAKNKEKIQNYDDVMTIIKSLM